ncbi:unnamed protein product [Ranitomeya imitator]|uniref:Lysophospholipid acyltransferase 5 n=1 Tax=Ranitomeya imitator TaxID=111125 RepID=A0ABN9L4Y6_9NEOB|nr:unnamed protein product [Ranitomeya imitator]
MTIWGKITLYKYVTCWLVTEGVCILSGLGYNGKDETGQPLWDACANMKAMDLVGTAVLHPLAPSLCCPPFVLGAAFFHWLFMGTRGCRSAFSLGQGAQGLVKGPDRHIWGKTRMG